MKSRALLLLVFFIKASILPGCVEDCTSSCCDSTNLPLEQEKDCEGLCLCLTCGNTLVFSLPDAATALRLKPEVDLAQIANTDQSRISENFSSSVWHPPAESKDECIG